jgi:malonyl-CoA/methylmalonyl-CoA synthetase
MGISANLSTQCLQERKDLSMEKYRRAPHLPVYTQIENHRSKIAISDVNGDYLYEDVYMRSWDLAKGIIGLLGDSGQGQRICFLCPSGLTHVITSWACWMSGNVAVPLCPGSDQARLEHLMMDSSCSVVVTTKDQVERVHPITKAHGQKLIVLDETWWTEPKQETDQVSPLPEPFVDPELYKNSSALILYTAGMTGLPKGVVLSHSILGNQIERVVDAWDWSSSDSVLHTLSLGNVYGLINSLQAPLSTGARITLMPTFDSVKVWSHLLGVGVNTGNSLAKINTFPGVPVMYSQLLAKADELFKDKKTRDYVKTTCSKRIRLMMSSTATLPPQIVTQWKNVTGHRVLENFISTEAGTALCNRVAGSGNKQGPGCQDCGAPTSKTQTQVVRFRDHTKTAYDVLASGDEAGTKVENQNREEEKVIGELRLRGDSVATKYWMEGAEVDIKMDNGWFNTGDIVQYSKGCYKVWGRLNMANINHKGKMVNAASIEKRVLSHKDIDDCYVVGIGDIQSEQKIAAIIVINQTKKVNIENILEWCSENMDESEIPTLFKLVTGIARDSSGHVDKLKIKNLFNDEPLLCFYDSKL